MNAIATTTYAKGAIIGRTDREALAKLRQARAAGRILEPAGELTLITKGARAGQYAIPVYLIMRPEPEPARPSRLPVALAGILIPLGLLALLGWFLSSLTAGSLALFLGAVLAAFLGWLKVAYGRPRGHRTTVTTTVTID